MTVYANIVEMFIVIGQFIL